MFDDAPPTVTEAERHGVYPELGHDERARLNFLMSSYRVLSQRVAPGNQSTYEKIVEPAFARENGRAPANRHEVRLSLIHI